MRLPPPFPDELLLGRLIRHVTVSGETAGTLAQRLFGSSRASTHPFITSGLVSLAESFQEDVGTLLYGQTLAPLFFLYLPLHAERLRASILANEGAKALRESQLPSFGSGHSVCLKWCPLCAQHDLQEFGVTYWNRFHQIPGITACFKHPVLLQRVELDRRQRLIPGLLPTCNGYPRPSSLIESRVAEFSQSLLTRLGEDLPAIEFATVYRQRLNELGYITFGGRVRRQSLLRRFAVEVEQYRSSPDSPLLRSRDDYRYISELLESNGSHHPFRHLLFGAWLFNTPDYLFGYEPPLVRQAPAQKDVGEKHTLDQRCLKLLQEGHSMAEIYRVTGKSRCYLKRLAMRQGITLNLKPKNLTFELQHRIISLAQSGMHRRAISKHCRIGIGSVEQIIASEPGLVEWRKQCHWESKRRRCITQIVRFRQQYPQAIRQEIKARCKAAYYWLYLNDRGWFNYTMPTPLKATGRVR